MQKRISTLPFQGTKEQQEQLFKVIDEKDVYKRQLQC